jgi:hypothetical protein
LDTARYAQPNEIMGKISFFALCGDHLQLPPVPKSSGLLAPLEHTSDEHKAGAAIFNNMHYLFEMETMKRFHDPVLIAILQKMRKPKGAKLTAEEWQDPPTLDHYLCHGGLPCGTLQRAYVLSSEHVFCPETLPSLF